MKQFTKISICLFALALISHVPAFSQVCTFAGAECCGEGITNFQLNGTPAINRTSTVNENGGFTNTGVTTTVTKGQSYNYSITFPLENNIVNCNTFNMKIYVDYNHNDILTDAGEEVAALNNTTNGTWTGSFTIPTSAMTGNAYMRVIMKMAATSLSGGSCGHSAITPCNIPADPVGFHGEVENYTLNITGGTAGMEGISSSTFSLLAYPNPTSKLLHFENMASNLKSDFQVYNQLGERVKAGSITNNELSIEELKSGIYFIRITNSQENGWVRFVKE